LLRAWGTNSRASGLGANVRRGHHEGSTQHMGLHGTQKVVHQTSNFELAHWMGLRSLTASMAIADSRDVYGHASYTHAAEERRRTYARWFWAGDKGCSPFDIVDDCKRTQLVRFRLGAHQLEVTAGAWKGIERRKGYANVVVCALWRTKYISLLSVYSTQISGTSTMSFLRDLPYNIMWAVA
jgi:hypothetical protein